LCCTACDEAMRAGQPVGLLVACEGCVARYDEEGYGDCIAWRGAPGIEQRPEPIDTTVVETPLPDGFGPVVDLAPIAALDRSAWLLLTEDGTIARFDAEHRQHQRIATSTVPAEPEHRPWAGKQLRRRLYASPDGRFAAVVNDFGHHGQVLDLDAGSVTLTLHGGDYHPDTVPFSLALAEHGGRTVVVHRTAWNRLDVSDARTGELLTARDTPGYGPDRERPDHYLDYFHGGLHLSPTGRRVADDGWVWHPVGVPSAWELRRWLDGNVWESEDGETRVNLCYREYHWNIPMCWIGDDLLAVSGIGDDDLAILPGARIFDVTADVELIAFPGPRGQFFAAGRRLYAADPDGLTVWDPFTGHRTGTVPGFVPTHHHPGAGELAAVADGRLRRWRTDQ